MARWISPGKIVKNGRKEISVSLKLKKLPKWINIEEVNIKDDIEFNITTLTYGVYDNSVELDLSLVVEPDNFDEWCKSFEGYINHVQRMWRLYLFRIKRL
jgi:hypothetical protein